LAIGIHGLDGFFDGDMSKVVGAVRTAEAVGIDCVTVVDHVLMSIRTDRYPYGEFPLPVEYPWYEPLTLLSVIAGSTQRIRLATGVLITPLRPAVLLAKIVATLDVLSNGRIDLGVGTGWQREEYAAVGVPFERRAERLMDILRACRALWSTTPTSYESNTVSFADIYSLPKPRQGGEVPIWFGMAANQRNCQRFAELGVGWVPMRANPVEIAPDIERIRGAFESAGRDPAELRVRAQLPMGFDGNRPSLERTLEGARASIDVGVTDLELYPAAFIGSAEELPDFFEAFVAVRERCS
jgi:probable F420-dependent oxidoreductase